MITRETKLGLIVASTFIAVVGGVVVTRLIQTEAAFAQAPHPEETTPVPENSEPSEPSTPKAPKVEEVSPPAGLQPKSVLKKEPAVPDSVKIPEIGPTPTLPSDLTNPEVTIPDVAPPITEHQPSEASKEAKQAEPKHEVPPAPAQITEEPSALVPAAATVEVPPVLPVPEEVTDQTDSETPPDPAPLTFTKEPTLEAKNDEDLSGTDVNLPSTDSPPGMEKDAQEKENKPDIPSIPVPDPPAVPEIPSVEQPSGLPDTVIPSVEPVPTSRESEENTDVKPVDPPEGIEPPEPDSNLVEPPPVEPVNPTPMEPSAPVPAPEVKPIGDPPSLDPVPPPSGDQPDDPESAPDSVPARLAPPIPSSRPDSGETGDGPTNSIAPASATNTRTVAAYDEDLHYVKDNESYEQISTRYYNDPAYGVALQRYNREHRRGTDHPDRLFVGQVVKIPPIWVLRRDFGGAVPQLPGVTRSVQARSVAPARGDIWVPASTPATSASPGDYYQPYTVQNERGETMREIARRTLGSGDYWRRVWDLNRVFDPGRPIPYGTKLRLPPEARVR